MVLFFALTGVAAAQGIVQIDAGIRGGLLANGGSFRAHQLCSGAGCAFGTRSFTAEDLRGTVGPTVGALIYDRVEVRFEAVRRRFGYQTTFDLAVPSTTQHFVESVRGYFWEYPLLAMYHFGAGPARPFAGGGFSLGTSGSYTRTSEGTSTLQLPGQPLTITTSFSRQTFPFTAVDTYYLTGGVDGRVSYISIRPEFRYSRLPGGSSSNATAILRPNQFEFLLGITFHPFRVQK